MYAANSAPGYMCVSSPGNKRLMERAATPAEADGLLAESLLD